MKKNLSLLIMASILCGIVAGCGTPKSAYESLAPSSATTEITLHRGGAFSEDLAIFTNLSLNGECKPSTMIGSLTGNKEIIVAPINQPIKILGMVGTRHASKLTRCGPIEKVFTPQSGIKYSAWMEVTEKICILKIHVVDNGKLISEVEAEVLPKCQPAK